MSKEGSGIGFPTFAGISSKIYVLFADQINYYYIEILSLISFDVPISTSLLKLHVGITLL